MVWTGLMGFGLANWVEFIGYGQHLPPSSGGARETEYHYSKLGCFFAQVASLRMDCCIFF